MNGILELQLPPHKRATAARSRAYKILSGVFTYPSDGRQKEFVLRGAGLALREAASDLPFGLPALEALGRSCPSLPEVPEDIEVMYSSLFDNCTGRPALSLHEKDYSKTDMRQIWEECIRFYEHFGLDYDFKHCREWPDHICIQLEFLHYLTFMEAGASDAVAEVYVAAESDFLERHVAQWIPQFGEKLRLMSGETPYGCLGRVLAQFVEGELEFNKHRRLVQ